MNIKVSESPEISESLDFINFSESLVRDELVQLGAIKKSEVKLSITPKAYCKKMCCERTGFQNIKKFQETSCRLVKNVERF